MDGIPGRGRRPSVPAQGGAGIVSNAVAVADATEKDPVAVYSQRTTRNITQINQLHLSRPQSCGTVYVYIYRGWSFFNTPDT